MEIDYTIIVEVLLTKEARVKLRYLSTFVLKILLCVIVCVSSYAEKSFNVTPLNIELDEQRVSMINNGKNRSVHL